MFLYGVARAVAQVGAWGLALAWIAKAVSVARGLRRLADLHAPQFDHTPDGEPSITVIVPACNEEASVARCVSSLLEQDYPALRVVAVDDRSVDATGAILDELAAGHPSRLTVLHVTELPPGWLGKTHAMAVAARHTLAVDAPRWLLFTDGDVIFTPEAIRRSLVFAVREQADHAVTLPTALTRTAGEAMILGCLQVLGFWAVRAWRVADPRARDAVGVGAFNLLRAEAYAELNGFEALRLEIVEDLALGRRVKQLGLRQRVAFGPGLVSVHWAAGIDGVLRTMTKNLFAIFQYRLLLLCVGCGGLLLLCLGPFAALVVRGCRVPGLLGLLAIAAIYRVSAPLTRVPAGSVAGFPVAAVLFLFAIVRSAVITLRDGGVTWRGTFYPLAELRQAAAAKGSNALR